MAQVVMAYTVGIAACLAAFYFTPASWTVVQWTTVFFIGFFLYGPQMLIGLCGAELVSTIPIWLTQQSNFPLLSNAMDVLTSNSSLVAL